MDSLTARRRATTRFITVAVGLLLTGLAGYTGFVSFVGSDRDVAAGTLALAAATGFAAFFSPCSFPLLLTFLSRRGSSSLGGAVASAGRVGGGALAFFAIAAGVVVLTNTAVATVVALDTVTGRIFRAVIGTLIITLGLRHARLINIRIRWFDRVSGVTGKRAEADRVAR